MVKNIFSLVAVSFMTVFILSGCVNDAPEEVVKENGQEDKIQEEISEEPLDVEVWLEKAGETEEYIIKFHYTLINDNKLKESYDLIVDNENSFEAFSEQYQNTTSVEVYDITRQADGKFHYFIKIVNDEMTENHRVIAEIKDQKINIIDSQKLTGEVDSQDGMSVYILSEDYENFVVLYMDGVEEVIDSGGDAFSTEHFDMEYESVFSSPELSSLGLYITYAYRRFEFFSAKIYDVANKKVLGEFSGGMTGFSPDDKFFYNCKAPRYTPDVGVIIYSMPDFKEIYSVDNLGKEGIYFVNECSIGDDGKLTAQFSSSPKSYSSADEKRSIVYDFESGEGVVE